MKPDRSLTQEDLFAGCLGLEDVCRIIVVPSTSAKGDRFYKTHTFYCKPIDYIKKSNLVDEFQNLSTTLKDYRRTRKLRHQLIYLKLNSYKLYPFSPHINLLFKDQTLVVLF